MAARPRRVENRSHFHEKGRRNRLRPPRSRYRPVGAYFIADETLLKVDLRLVPTPCMAAIAATAIRAAIRPYSMAVAPLLLLISLRMKLMVHSPGSVPARGGPHLRAPRP